MGKEEIDSCRSQDDAVIRALLREKESLSQQVKQLVKAETKLYEYQEELDAQLKEYKNLYALHKKFDATMDIASIISLTVSYVIEELEYERVLFFLKEESAEQYAVSALDGYYDPLERAEVTQLVIEKDDPILFALDAAADCIVCTADSQEKVVTGYRKVLHMNEYLLYPLGSRECPPALLAVGNSREKGEFYRRVTGGGQLGMGNLVGLLSASLENRFFYTRLQKALDLQKKSELMYRQLNETLEQRIAEAVDELREKERLLIIQARQTVMGELLTTIAHHWRQPLNTLGLIAQEMPVMYDMGAFSKKYLEESVEKTMEVLKRMSKTIDDFGYFFRSNHAKVKFRVREVMEKTLSLLEESFKAYGIRTEIEVAGDPVIHGRPSEFTQVIVNILNNSRDAFLKVGIEDPLITLRASTEEGHTVVSVTDNAGGIPDKIMDRIFEPYFSTKGPEYGTGIGLYMSKVIVERHMNGTLTVRNTGRGAEFTMVI